MSAPRTSPTNGKNSTGLLLYYSALALTPAWVMVALIAIEPKSSVAAPWLLLFTPITIALAGAGALAHSVARRSNAAAFCYALGTITFFIPLIFLGKIFWKS